MTRMLVVAKAPVVGRVKTRLGADIGMDAAAAIAAASLLDTLDACAGAVGAADCVLSLAGDLDDAIGGAEIRHHLGGWAVHEQRGADFAERLVNAHLDAGPGVVVQVGMDTPQVTPRLLSAAAAALEGHDATLGPAEDGGWWVLVRRDADTARALADVPMSTPTTCDDTRAALASRGLKVSTTATLRDVDTVSDAVAVAAAAPASRFAHAWSTMTGARP